MNRSDFLKKSLAAGTTALIVPKVFSQETERPIFTSDQIYDFVAAAHNDFDKVKAIYQETPLILNCANQIKRGDFETALGGASHMGRKDIANFLVSKGARMDIFSYVFLGFDNFVMKQIELYPALLESPGPHGFTLLHHAKVGGRTELMEWLSGKGLTETFIKGAFG